MSWQRNKEFQGEFARVLPALRWHQLTVMGLKTGFMTRMARAMDIDVSTLSVRARNENGKISVRELHDVAVAFNVQFAPLVDLTLGHVTLDQWCVREGLAKKGLG